jgi:diguanylate cyclase (GGDEF)-like protein
MQLINSKNIPTWIMILPIFGIIITTIFITLTTIYTIKNNFTKEKKIITQEFMSNLKYTTKQRVTLAYNILDSIYKINKKDKYRTIKMMQKVFDKLKWDKKGYVFVFDYKGNTLFHINKYYMTINRWNFKRNGINVIRKLILDALKSPNGVYSKYLAYNPDGRPINKISYLKIYKPLNLIIGSGVYLDYLDKRLVKKQQGYDLLLENIIKKIVFIAIAISLAMIFVMYLLSKQVKHILQLYDKRIKRKQKELFLQANFDNLTSLHNRQHFLFELKEAIQRIKRDQQKIAVLFIDIDHFKEINDSKGHHIGDEVLKIVAKRLKESVRETDIVGRFGGDEFVILINIKSTNEISELVNRILIELKQPIVIEHHQHFVSGSIGISIAPDDSTDLNELIQFADSAMYKSKNDGKDRYNFYNAQMTKDAKERFILKTTLHYALKNNELDIYFQPQIDKEDNLIGAEVLVRWNHPNKGIVSPYHFIPLAIELGIIDKVDLWVIENAIIQHTKWQQKGLKVGILSCNITMYDIEKDRFIDDIKSLIHKHNFNPYYLNLEVTEETIMKNPKKSIAVLNKLKNLGININIDDFGTGYSSLAYLKKLPISKLKIDKSFIKDIPQSKDDMAISKTIIDLAKNLNLEVIAEGVETEIQKKFLFDNGCNYIQGYIYSQPLKIEYFEKKFLLS